MTTLRIEHEVTDFDTWLAAFNRFAETRRNAGVRAYRVFQPVTDPHFVSIDLDFDAETDAEGFLRFLRTQVWTVPENAPALVGSPVTRLLVLTDSQVGTRQEKKPARARAVR